MKSGLVFWSRRLSLIWCGEVQGNEKPRDRFDRAGPLLGGCTSERALELEL
jgi:hypothetical protein